MTVGVLNIVVMGYNIENMIKIELENPQKRETMYILVSYCHFVLFDLWIPD